MASRGRVDNRLQALVRAVDDAVAMLEGFAVATDVVTSTENPGSLLEQCLALCAQVEAAGPEPVRTLHHFACTGGSLISKCLAAMPNTQLLSEVDPLSRMLAPTDGRPRFTPSDMISLVRDSARGASQALIIEMFLADLQLIHEESVRLGQRVVLRDHAHGHYCLDSIEARPGLRDIVAMRFPVLSALTVRHPLDSYLALRANGWIQHRPPNLDEYCRRYLAFLSDHAGVPVVRYEDVVAAPQLVLPQLCAHLRLPYRADFIDVFDALPVTGESGRAGTVIGRRVRRPVDTDLQGEAAQSPGYRSLLQQLDYEF
jgi:hypothetical protein